MNASDDGRFNFTRSTFEHQYMNLLLHVGSVGNERPSRVGRTRSAFGLGLYIDSLTLGEFPILTTRRIYYEPIFGELAAFLRGATYVGEFKKHGCNYWDANAAAWPFNANTPPDKHYVGRVYGAQWRRWATSNHETEDVDQIARLVRGIKDDPYGRRHIVTCWRPDEFDLMCLPPCHIFFQCYVVDGTVEMMVYMRSVDLCLGLPSDIVLYAALLLLIAKETGYKPGILKFMFGDAHMYQNHGIQFVEQSQRPIFDHPKYLLDVEATLDNFEPHHIELEGYKYAEPIRYPLNV